MNMPTRWTRGGYYQRGAETVEFLLTLSLFLMLFFMVIEFAIAVYDRGAIMNATRDGSRQSTLYWADPVLFDPTTPLQNRRMKRAMIDTVMTYTAQNLLIDPAQSGLNLDLERNGTEVTTATLIVAEDDKFSVNLTFPYKFFGLWALGGSSGGLLRSVSTQSVE